MSDHQRPLANRAVNAVAPGMIRTPLYDTWVADQPTHGKPKTSWPAFP